MTTLFAYPWTLQEEGVVSACETIRSHDVDDLTDTHLEWVESAIE